MKFVVIGGVAGGPSFATRLRRLDETAEIVMIEKGAHISYASCALPYYLGGVVEELDSLIERTPEILQEKNNIDVRVFHEMIKIDPDNKTITVKNLKTTEEYEESYDALILSTGTRASLPPITGITEAENVFTLRNVTDAAVIMDYINTHLPRHVTILGAGIAGLEIAENMKHRGLAVTIIDQASTVALPYDPEIANIIQQELDKNKVEVILEQTVKEVGAAGKTITLADGRMIETDLLIVAAGVRLNNEIAKAAGIEVAADEHIIVDDRLQTNVPDIYGIGDVVETKSLINDLPTPSMLSSAANRQGHLLADILHGEDLRYHGYIGVGVAQIFSLTASYAGYTENMLKRLGITNYKTIFITPFDHAYFYPDAKRLNLKIIFEEKTGKILGGQAVGERGVDKRIGELSVAITGKLTVHDLPALELPYSPPYSTTRDPLNTAGYVAINQLNKTAETIKATEIPAEDLKQAFFLDIREADKPKSGSIEATKNIPLSELRERLNEIPRDRKVYLTFRKGLNTYNAARILAGKGIEAIMIEE